MAEVTATQPQTAEPTPAPVKKKGPGKKKMVKRLIALGVAAAVLGGGGFALLSRNGEILVQAEGRVLETGGVLRAEVPFHDSRGHTALCEWQKGELLSCTVRTARAPTPATFALALFESVLLGLDASPFLSPELEADALKEYLGEFRSVVMTDEEDRVGLIYPRRERVFDVRYFTVETDGGRICNIVPVP